MRIKNNLYKSLFSFLSDEDRHLLRVEIDTAVDILQHRLGHYLGKNSEINNIFTVLVVYNAVVAEIFVCRERILPEYDNLVIGFEEWIEQEMCNEQENVGQKSYQEGPSGDLFLVYPFKSCRLIISSLKMISLKSLVEAGTDVTGRKLIDSVEAIIPCPECGVKRGELHELCCPFEQCPNCKGFINRCPCGEGKLPKGWIKTLIGPEPSDKVRIPFGNENFGPDELDFLNNVLDVYVFGSIK